MSVQDSNYILTALTPAAPGWSSVWYEASSTATLQLHAEPVVLWAIAQYQDSSMQFTETVGLCISGSGLEPLESEDGQAHVGYLLPDGDPEQYRPIALARFRRQLKKWAEEDARRAERDS